MSLEQELMRNTEALIALTAALSKTAIFPVIETTTTAAPVEKVKPPKPSAVVATPPETSPAAPTSDAPAVEYADVAAAITAVFKTDRARVMQALANFGAAKGPQLKPADYAAFLKELAA